MKKSLVLAVIICFAASALKSQELKKALFLGNSYTYVNDLPALVAQIASSKGDSFFHLKYTPGGYTFQLHSQDPLSRAAIKAGSWDYVILQEQSQLPALWPDSVAVTTYPYADTLNRFVKENDSCSVTMFFMTWGRKYGDTQFCPVYPPVCTYEGMQARLRESYLTMGQMFGAEVSPVGIAWKNTRALNPGIELYQGDFSHPSLNGSYLAACTFYAAIFHKSPVGGFVPAGISQQTADSLQFIASQAVFDSLTTWQIDTTAVRAAFTYIPQSSWCFQFANQSQNAQDYYWDFGDGSHSALANPLHCYIAPGSYPVKLFASDGCKYDSSWTNIVITSASGERNMQCLQLSPNPSRGVFRITGPGAETGNPFEIISAAGMQVMRGSTGPGGTISATSLSAGLYTIIITASRQTFIARFLISR